MSAASRSCCARVEPMPWPASKSTRSRIGLREARRCLQPGGHLADVEGRDPRVGHPGGQQHRRVGDAILDRLVAVDRPQGPVAGLLGDDAPLGFLAVTVLLDHVAQGVGPAHPVDDGREQLRPLGHSPAHRDAPGRAAADGQARRRWCTCARTGPHTHRSGRARCWACWPAGRPCASRARTPRRRARRRSRPRSLHPPGRASCLQRPAYRRAARRSHRRR